jgi:hypothetical protein
MLHSGVGGGNYLEKQFSEKDYIPIRNESLDDANARRLYGGLSISTVLTLGPLLANVPICQTKAWLPCVL